MQSAAKPRSRPSRRRRAARAFASTFSRIRFQASSWAASQRGGGGLGAAPAEQHELRGTALAVGGRERLTVEVGEDGLQLGAARERGRCREARQHAVEQLPHDGRHELPLGLEVEVEGPPRDAGLADHVPDLRRLKPVALDDAHRGGHQERAPLGGGEARRPRSCSAGHAGRGASRASATGPRGGPARRRDLGRREGRSRGPPSAGAARSGAGTRERDGPAAVVEPLGELDEEPEPARRQEDDLAEVDEQVEAGAPQDLRDLGVEGRDLLRGHVDGQRPGRGRARSRPRGFPKPEADARGRSQSARRSMRQPSGLRTRTTRRVEPSAAG